MAGGDDRYLGTASVIADRCIVCGARPAEGHHEPPRSRFPGREAEIPVFSLCGPGNAGGCHALAHRNGGTLTIKPTNDSRWTHAVADERAAAAINRRRKAHGLKPVKPGIEFLCAAHRQADEDEGKVLFALKRRIDEASVVGVAAAWEAGQALRQAREEIETGRTRPETAEMWREFLDSLEKPLSKGQASKLMTIATLPREAAMRLSAVNAYQAARAVRDGLLELDEAVELASQLSAQDFRLEVWGGEEDKRECGICPVDGGPCRRAAKGGDDEG